MSGPVADAMKRTTSLLRSEMQSQEARFQAKIGELEETCAAQARTIADLNTSFEELKSSRILPAVAPAGGSSLDASALSMASQSFETIKDDVQTVIDAMRLELTNVKKTLHGIIETNRSDIAVNKANVKKNRDSLDDLYSKFTDLSVELADVRDRQEYISVKAGFLAIAATECSYEDKDQMFKQLQQEEEAYNRKRGLNAPGGPDAGLPALGIQDVPSALRRASSDTSEAQRSPV
jgi:uncharacterized coiled-coil protein SlyX